LREVRDDRGAVCAQTTPYSTVFCYSTLHRQSILTTTISAALENQHLHCRLLGALSPLNQSRHHHLRHCPIKTLLLAIVCYTRLIVKVPFSHSRTQIKKPEEYKKFCYAMFTYLHVPHIRTLPFTSVS
jgi:hypothetical protein